MSHDFSKSVTLDNKLETLGLFSFDTLISAGDKYGLHPNADRFDVVFNSFKPVTLECLVFLKAFFVYAQSYEGKAVRSEFPKRWKFE
jgi:hypothetical protein